MKTALNKIGLTEELTNKWLEALRSGKYEQSDSFLCHYNNETNQKAYCCLGVLCDVYEPESWDDDDLEEMSEPISVAWNENLEYPGMLNTVNNEACLAELNDSRGFNFKMIADFIEDYLKTEIVYPNMESFYEANYKSSAR
jgi:hypothetical protein